MSTFINIDDYTLVIEHEELLRICKGDLTKLEEFENSTRDEVAGAICKIYKVEETFAKTGNERDKYLLKLMLKIIVYETCSSVNPEEMTNVIMTNYEHATSKLQKISDGKHELTKATRINEPAPDEPPTSSEDVFFSSSEKRDNQFI